MFTAKDVAALRAQTNAGMMDCKKALTECDGDFEKATQWLREKGIAAASKKQSRIASEGVVGSYIHMGGKIGVLVVPADVLEKEKEILRAQAINEGKPAAIVDKMVEGRVVKFYKDYCLLDQEFVKDSSKTIQTVLNEATLTIGEKITVRRFTRYEMGEGLEKRHDDLAEEVAKMSK